MASAAEEVRLVVPQTNRSRGRAARLADCQKALTSNGEEQEVDRRLHGNRETSDSSVEHRVDPCWCGLSSG